MEFLDNLILGKNTPRYADDSTFPSKTYKKNLCRKKHCGASCLRDSQGDWEFWALCLSCKPLNQVELNNKILNLKGSLRFSLWKRLVEEETKTKAITKAKTKKIDEERDKEILGLILHKFRNKKIDEEELFNILVSDSFKDIDQLEMFVDFVYNLLDLPFADIRHLKEVLEFLNEKLKLKDLFQQKDTTKEDTTKEDTKDKDKEDTKEDKDIKEDKDKDQFPFNSFVEHLLYKDFLYFCRIIDLLLCFKNTTFKEVLNFFLESNSDSNFDSFLTLQNLKDLKNFLENKPNTLQPLPSGKSSSPTYYDFIVVQNETIKAQENIKEEYVNRINELENQNKELSSSLQHFKEVSGSLEQELNDYQDGYVKDITKMLDKTKKVNDELEKEVLRLKEELCKSKRNVK